MPFVAMVTGQLADKEHRLSCRDLKSHVSPRSLLIWFLTNAAHLARCKSSHLQSDVPHSPSFSFAVKPTVIDVGIYVNSIGPVSSIDMVSPRAPFHYSSLCSCSLCPQVKAGGNAGGQTRGQLGLSKWAEFKTARGIISFYPPLCESYEVKVKQWHVALHWKFLGIDWLNVQWLCCDPWEKFGSFRQSPRSRSTPS